MFRVGLVLLKQMLGSVDKLREMQGMYETMERLRNISPDTIREDILVHEVIYTHRHERAHTPTHMHKKIMPSERMSRYQMPSKTTKLVSIRGQRFVAHPSNKMMSFPLRVCFTLVFKQFLFISSFFFPLSGLRSACNGGFDREGVHHPGEEVARVSWRPDTPARPQASRNTRHQRAKAPRCRHQLRGKSVLPGQLHVVSAARPPSLLFQPPVSSWLPEIQKPI